MSIQSTLAYAGRIMRVLTSLLALAVRLRRALRVTLPPRRQRRGGPAGRARATERKARPSVGTRAALALALMAPGCAMPLGCAYTAVSRGEVRVTRVAVLYPAEAGQVEVASSPSNEVWRVTGYRSDGGASAAAAVTAAAVTAALKGATP